MQLGGNVCLLFVVKIGEAAHWHVLYQSHDEIGSPLKTVPCTCNLQTNAVRTHKQIECSFQCELRLGSVAA